MRLEEAAKAAAEHAVAERAAAESTQSGARKRRAEGKGGGFQGQVRGKCESCQGVRGDYGQKATRCRRRSCGARMSEQKAAAAALGEHESSDSRR